MNTTVAEAERTYPPANSKEGNQDRDGKTSPGNFHLSSSQGANETKMMCRLGLMPCLMRPVGSRCQRCTKQQKRQQSAKDCFPGPAKAGLTISEHGF